MKKKVLAIFFSLCLCFSLTMTAAAANISSASEELVVPQNATLEIIDGKYVYSNFTDSAGNYYDYYCPETGAYFRWTPSAEILSPRVNTYEVIRPFEFYFDNDGLTGRIFEINYDGGYYIVQSQLHNHFYDEEYTEALSPYEFTVTLKQEKIFPEKIATLNTETKSQDAKFYTCTNGGRYFFKLDMVDRLPQDTATVNLFVKGSGTIYGTVVL